MTAVPAKLFHRVRAVATGPIGSIAMGIGATNVLRLASTLVLTRLLVSKDYGVVGVITSISFALTMLSEVGMFDFIVRHRDGDAHSFRNEIWTIRLIRAVTLTVLMALLSTPAAMLLGKPELGPVIAVWSLNFLLDGLSSLAFATAVREQKLWRLSLLDLGASVAQFIVAIAASYWLRSYWGLIIGMLGGAAFKTTLSYVLFPNARHRVTFSRPRAREVWGFSRNLALSSALSLLILQLDKVVLARLMPLSTYGLYALATTLTAASQALLGPYVKRVLLPAYAKAARTEPSTLRTVLYARRRKFALLHMTMMGGLIGAAPLIVALLYDPRYQGITPYLQLLAISAVVRLSSLSANQAMLALGNTRSQLLANIMRMTWLGTGAIIGIATGHIMLLVAFVGTSELVAMSCFWANLRKHGLLDLRAEALGFAVAGLGLAGGFGLTALARAVAPALLV